MRGTTQIKKPALLLICGICGFVSAQSPVDVEVSEMRLNLAASVERVQTLQNQLDLAKRQVLAMTETLTRLQTQNNAIKTELIATETKLEASSMSQTAVKAGSSSGDRVIALLKELKQVRDQNESVTSKGRKLIDLLARKGQLPVEISQMVSEFDAAVMAASQQNYVDGATTTISIAQCQAVNKKLGLGIVNAGTSNGFKNGLPLSIRRGTQQVARAMVVDARNTISGIVLTDGFSLEDDSTDEGLTAEIDQELKR